MADEQQIKEKEDQILRSSLRKLQESKTLLENTTEELDRQGISLRKTEQRVLNIESASKDAERMSNQISSFWSGLIGNFLPKQKPSMPATASQKRSESVQLTEKAADDGDVLDQLNKTLGDMKSQGLQLSKELHEQNVTIDRINVGMVNSNTRLDSSNKKLNKFLK